MKDNVDHWDGLSILDVLRPPEAYVATDVLLSSYSLDLVVMVSALLAVTGQDEISGGGSKIALSKAIEQCRKASSVVTRFAVFVQKGRVRAPDKFSIVTSLLDQFVYEQGYDQGMESWHSKLILVRFEPKQKKSKEKPIWRFWVGSRNLSRDTSWDTGLVIVSKSEKGGSSVNGLDEIASTLFQKGGWTRARNEELLNELKKTKWQLPAGVTTLALHWLKGKGKRRFTPHFNKEKADELILITPFFDKPTIKKIDEMVKCDGEKYLISTLQEFSKRKCEDLSSLWRLSVIGASQQSEQERLQQIDDILDVTEEQDEEPQANGLHAKIIAARFGKNVKIYLGSANLTQRAWNRNGELVAEVDCDESVFKGVKALAGLSTTLPTDLVQEDANSKELEDVLNGFYNKLCNIRLKASISSGLFKVSGDSTPLVLFGESNKKYLSRIELSVSSLSGDFVSWPLDRDTVYLSETGQDVFIESEFLRFKLLIADSDGNQLSCSWIQKAQVTPALGVDRDKLILRKYLTTDQYIEWLNSVLEGGDCDGDPWDNGNNAGQQAKTFGLHRKSGLPTTEVLLKAWQRNPKALHEAKLIFDRYIDGLVLKPNKETENKESIDFLVKLKGEIEEITNAIGQS